MSEPRSVQDLDFSPLPGKTYFDCDREWACCLQLRLEPMQFVVLGRES